MMAIVAGEAEEVEVEVMRMATIQERETSEIATVREALAMEATMVATTEDTAMATTTHTDKAAHRPKTTKIMTTSRWES